MLQITVPGGELLNEKTNEFITMNPQILQLEHSLISISKWEAKWKKPFLSKTEKTNEESRDYIRCMTLNNVDSNTYVFLTKNNVEEINAYMTNPMTATTINDRGASKKSNETITSELIYYWMIAANIPMECQKWHINRLLMLIRVCGAKNAPEKKMSRSAIMSQNKAINDARRARLKTSG